MRQNAHTGPSARSVKNAVPPPGFRLQGPRRCAHEIVRERSRVLSLFIVRDVRPCGGVPAELCVKGPVRGGVPAELCVKGLVPEILAQTFFVDISWWFSRLDLPTGGNLRGRRRLLESARVAPPLPYMSNFFSILGAVIFENLRVLKQFSAKKIRT